MATVKTSALYVCYRELGVRFRWWQMGGQEPLSWCPVAVRKIRGWESVALAKEETHPQFFTLYLSAAFAFGVGVIPTGYLS